MTEKKNQNLPIIIALTAIGMLTATCFILSRKMKDIQKEFDFLEIGE